jgi:hypothetical protein
MIFLAAIYIYSGMSTQAELNLNYTYYILYYCNVENADPTVYQTDLSDVCAVIFDGSNNIAISAWLILGYPQPSMAHLLTYTLVTVLTFFNNFYAIPAAIVSQQPYAIDATTLAAIRTSSALDGCTILDTTDGVQKIWNGSSWSESVENPAIDNLAMGTHDITNVGSISGATNTRAADDIVSNAGTSADTNLASFSGTSGKVVQDSGIAAANVFLADGSVFMTGGMNMNNQGIGNTTFVSPYDDNASDLGQSGQAYRSLYLSTSLIGPTNSRAADDIVSNTGTSVDTNLASFSGTSGKVVQDSGILAANVVANTSTSTTGHLASFADTSGKIIQDAWQTLPLLGWGLQSGGTPTTFTSILGSTITFPANSTQRGSFIRFWGSLQVALGTAPEVLSLQFNSSVGGPFGGITITNNTGGGCSGRIMLDVKIFVMSGGFIHTSATLLSNPWYDPAVQVQLNDSESGTAWDETVLNVFDLQASFSVGTGSIAIFDNYYIEQVN